MRLLDMVILTVLFSNTSSGKKARYSASDEDSIENILYYKDKKARPVPPPLRVMSATIPTERPQPVCPCPKMCCTICCECSDSNSMFGRIQAQLPNQGVRQMETIGGGTMAGIGPPMGRKKRIFGPMGARRNNPVVTRQNIKSLISQDDDIKKILKDLVRVTIQKVDLQEMLKSKRAGNSNYTNGMMIDANILRSAVTEAINNYNNDMEIYDEDHGMEVES